MNGARRSARRAISLTVFVVFLALGLFVQWNETDNVLWQDVSEEIVIGRVYQVQEQQWALNRPQFLGKIDNDDKIPVQRSTYTHDLFLADAPYPGGYHYYWHGTGLQGDFFALINAPLHALGFSAQQRLDAMHFVAITIFLLVLCALCVWLYDALGLFAALLAGFCTLLSPWGMLTMGNLYWFSARFLVPMVVCAYVCRRIAREGKARTGLCIAVGASTLVTFLCGFEFVSTILIAMMLPAMYYLLTDAARRKMWLRASVIIGASGLAAFVFALILWFFQMLVGFEGDWQVTWEEFLMPIMLRTGVGGAEALPEWAAQSNSVPVLEMLRVYLQDSPMLLGLNMGWILLLYAAVVSVTACMCAILRKKAALMRQLPLLALCLIAVAAPCSWYILARGHSAIHTFVNYMLWLVPTMPILLAHMGFCVKTLCSIAAGEEIT